MRLGWLFAGCLVAASLAGCGSGQTGSPECVEPSNCLCNQLYLGGVLLRVHGESAASGQLVAVIDALLSPSNRTLGLAVGDRISGSVLAELPCAAEQSVGPLAGQELFVLYSPAGAGQDLDLLHGVFGWVVPWGDELSFGGGRQLPSADVAVLTDTSSCRERFADDPAPACNDSHGGIGCSTTRSTEAPVWPWPGVFLGIFGLAWASRRWVRRQSPPRAVR